jgi:energy-coupling factor transporter ATP-binding protein EcfA2
MTLQKPLTIEEIARKLKPLFGEKIDEIYFKYSIAEDLDEKRDLAQFLITLYQKNLSRLLEKGINLEPPRQEIVQGDYPLAKVIYGQKELFDFGLREKDWPRHVCITGMSGSGKTTLALNILKNFIQKDKPFLVFDWKKSFRPLINLERDLLVFTVGNSKVSNLFKTNINRPPKGVSPKEWINVLCDLLVESFSASFGVHKILLETLDEAFEGWGVYQDSELYPNWEHIKRMLESKSKDAHGRETGWYESALRIASVLTFGDFGKVVNYDGKKSLSIEDLFNKKVVFELNSLSNVEKKFFSEFILTYIYKLKKAQENSFSEGFNYSILVDEAHNVFLKKDTHFVSESVTDMVYREMREYGISLICLDQHISKLSDTVTGNSACHIAFQQQLPADIRTISSLMQLEDQRELFSSLSVGSAIVKLSERYTNPFLVQAPFMEIRKESATDEKIKLRIDCLIKGHDIEKNDKDFKNQIINPAPKTELIQKTNNSENPIKVREKEEPINQSPQTIYIKQKFPENRIQMTTQPFESPIYIGPNNSTSELNLDLNPTQKVLYDFAMMKLEKGDSLKEAEEILLSGLSEKLYTKKDVLIAINFAIDKSLESEKKEVVEVSPRDYASMHTQIPLSENFSKDERKFLSFLIENPDHELSTTEFYNVLGLSTRKGNIIKDKLLHNSYIKIQEIKYEKGWKKFIRLA